LKKKPRKENGSEPDEYKSNKYNKMVKEQLERMGRQAIIEIALTLERTANNWEEIADLRQKQIQFLEEKIKTLNEIEQDQLVQINKIRKENQKFTNNQIS